MKFLGRSCLIGVLASLLCANFSLAQQPETVRKITKIAGDLYRFQNQFHFSVFLVTSKGIIATDPINAEAAKWLKDELQKRFNQPVKYLIYSHDHSDHISGGEVFSDTATVIAHDNAKETIVGEKRPTAVPDITFNDKMTIQLGGKVVDLQYVGLGHSNNLIVMSFPEEKVLFVVDLVVPKRMPFKTLSDAYFPEWMDALRFVESMDFEILAPGHGPLGNKEDVTQHREYLEDLYSAVLQEARAGRTLTQVQESLKLDKYKDLGQYEAWLPLNIEGMYKNIQLHRRGN
jgi:glyoxylase-like metal-dependent hydrolase (beta-lactamase superfamily II)